MEAIGYEAEQKYDSTFATSSNCEAPSIFLGVLNAVFARLAHHMHPFG